MGSDETTKQQSKRPANTAFKQQRLKAWQPLLTPKTVLPTFFVVGLIFIPIGIGLYMASNSVDQIIFDYTNCPKAGTTFAQPDSSLGNLGPITEWKYVPENNTCSVRFLVPNEFKPPVFLYYRLTNFYQNHRRYVKSFDQSQLSGGIVDPSKLNLGCDPLRVPSQEGLPETMKNITLGPQAQYYPCGLVANSFFSDYLGGDPFEDNSVLQCISNQSTNPPTPSDTEYLFTQDGVAWPSDTEKFKSSSWRVLRPTEVQSNLIPPPDWVKAFPRWRNGYTADNLPDLQQWERLHVWMRTAGLPNFRKLYGANRVGSLTAGVYQLDIVNNFDVARFSGTKSIVISTVSAIGGKNPFLGIAYIVVGVVCWLLGIIFLIRQMVKPRKLGDHTYLSWNQPQPGQRQDGAQSSATSGGDNMRQRTGY
ncbi:ligand-effect modulator 3 family [Cladochytrium replicatum]|nr:ligand-effect modulator 3 family [Cladochytrium replicatum]